MNILENLLGGNNQNGQNNQNQRQDYQGFVNRYEQGHPAEGYTDEEVGQRYGQIAPQLSPEQYQSAAQQSFERLSPQEQQQFGQWLQERSQQQGYQMQPPPNQQYNPQYLAQQTTQMHQQQPNALNQLFGHGGALGSPLAKAAAAGIAALAAKQFLG